MLGPKLGARNHRNKWSVPSQGRLGGAMESMSALGFEESSLSLLSFLHSYVALENHFAP